MEINKYNRKFVANDLIITTWETLKAYFENLVNRSINSKEEYIQWLSDKSELEAVIEEDAAWRYIKMTIDTRDESLNEAYTFFVTKIEPELAPYADLLNKKLVESPFFEALNQQEDFAIYFRSVATALKLYREENIALEAELGEKSQLFGTISAAQSIEYNKEKITMQKASSLLREPNEGIRKEVYEKIATRRSQDIDQLNQLYNELIQLRHQVAQNAGFDNYRDYKFQALGRFDYTKEDCFNFHASVKKLIVPLVKEIQQKRLNLLGKTAFKPWDSEVDPTGKAPLKPFSNGKELLEGTIAMFNEIDPYFGDCLNTMDQMGHLDLDSKEGKAPGGYNYPLYEVGVPFIFMNSVGTQNDLVTMVHEGGHAVHSFLSRDLLLTSFKDVPSEVAELASMSMEMLTMNLWNHLYKNEEDFQRAKKEQLETVLKILPWIAQIDEFQHWIYENANHSENQRTEKWLQLCQEYGTGLTDWTGFEAMQANSWQRQLHLFEVPFYYIEYGIAQLGALAVWKNSIHDFKGTIEKYKTALAFGYTKTLPELYNAAGIKFDLSENYLSELVDFVKLELSKLN